MTERSGTKVSIGGGGIGFGCCLAMVISWSVYHNVLLAIFHGILSWLFVIYYALVMA